jgi:23S rRNA (cytidine1920-2'-O)/16S rRNA (cytidine1409-2'-O)-methyltransferase
MVGRDKPGPVAGGAGSRAGFASRGGAKLDAALEGFGVCVAGGVCADFGANVGGFTDCLLRRGAAKVFAVEAGYGALAWRLRRDPRVVVMERTNALYADPPAPAGVDLVVIDVAFTPQRLIVPAAARWLRPAGQIVSLLKPHYELHKLARPGRARSRAPMDFRRAAGLCEQVCRQLGRLGLEPLAAMVSPLKGKGGNFEFFLHLRPARRSGPGD